jgi:hypothetical protein
MTKAKQDGKAISALNETSVNCYKYKALPLLYDDQTNQSRCNEVITFMAHVKIIK